MPVWHSFGMNRIQEHLDRLEITQTQLGEMIGQTQGQVSRKANESRGCFNLRELRLISAAIGVPVSELVDAPGDSANIVSLPASLELTDQERELVAMYRQFSRGLQQHFYKEFKFATPSELAQKELPRPDPKKRRA